MKRFFLLPLIVSLAIVLPLSSASAEDVLNVPADYPTIQAGIDAAEWGDTVLVAPGEYVQSITLRPGVTVQSAGGPEVTTIRGDGSRWDTYWRVTYTVFGANDSIISGFTITGSDDAILNWHSSPTIINNVIANNVYGILNYDSSPAIVNNIISDNWWWGIKNVNSAPIISGNIITGASQHSAIFTVSGSSPTITNNTITGNLRAIYNGWSTLTITNNIIAENVYGILDYNSTSTITFNDLWGNETNLYNYYSRQTVADNISADPMFVDPGTGDYHLQESSPCIDAGTNDASGLSETDFEGNPRIADGDSDGVAVIDMGAFEFQPTCTQAPGFEITSFNPEYLWPPNRKIEDVMVSGRVSIPDGCTLLGAGYSMDDEYGLYSSEGELDVNADGYFTLILQVEPWRDGGDIDGRRYGISLFAEDEAGEGSKALEVLVPHDQRK